jgi:hypothetical protein
VRAIEEQAPPAIASVLLLTEDGRHLHPGAAPHLPEEYSSAIEGMPIGPIAGSCGTAASRRARTTVDKVNVMIDAPSVNRTGSTRAAVTCSQRRGKDMKSLLAAVGLILVATPAWAGGGKYGNLPSNEPPPIRVRQPRTAQDRPNAKGVIYVPVRDARTGAHLGYDFAPGYEPGSPRAKALARSMASRFKPQGQRSRVVQSYRAGFRRH